MIPFRKSLGFRLFVVSFILLALPLVIDSIILTQEHFRNMIRNAEEHLKDVAHERELPLTLMHPVKLPIFQVISSAFDLQENFPQAPSDQLNKKLEKIAQIGRFSKVYFLKITPKGGHVVVATSDGTYLGEDDTNFFLLNKLFPTDTAQKEYINYFASDSQTGVPSLVVVYVVYSSTTNQPIGSIVISNQIGDKISTLLATDTETYPVKFAIMLPSTILYSSVDPTLNLQHFQPLDPWYRKLFIKHEAIPADRLPDKPLPNHKIDSSFFEFTWKGEDYLGYIKALPEANYSLLTYASKKDILRRPLIEFINDYSIYGLVLLFGGSITFLIIRRMAKPLQTLSGVMEKIQQGDLTPRYISDPWGFEINDLGKIFDEMVDSVIENKKVTEEERIKQEMLEQELLLGQEAQKKLLRKQNPDYPGIDFGIKFIPAVEVGGDFFDIFVRGKEGEQQLVLAIADASGKGVHACLYSLTFRNILRAYAQECNDVADAMDRINRLFCADVGDTGMFITAVMGFYDRHTHTLSYSSWGHPPGLIRRKSGKVEVLKNSGMAMGFLSTHLAQTMKVQLDLGDTIVFYSDGITEAHNEEYEIFGETRLIQCLEEMEGLGAREMLGQIKKQMDAFTGRAPQHDDITMLAMRVDD